MRRNLTSGALIQLSVALLVAIGTLAWNRAPEHAPAGIAVLPFESLDGDKADAAFADGVHGEILSSLARVADLKVIAQRA